MRIAQQNIVVTFEQLFPEKLERLQQDLDNTTIMYDILEYCKIMDNT